MRHSSNLSFFLRKRNLWRLNTPNILRRRPYRQGSSSSSSSEGSQFLSWYSQKLETHPLLTKAITSGLISGTGDIICQVLSMKDDEDDTNDTTTTRTTKTTTTKTSMMTSWDTFRTLCFVTMGAFWVAPITHVWYNMLSTKIIVGPRTTFRIFQRLFIDQFGFAPFFAPSFMGGLWILEQRDEIFQPLIEVSPSLIVANWTLWIPAQLINFSLIPLKYQVLFGNVVALGWSVYLSFTSATSNRKSIPTTTTGSSQ